MVIFEIKDTLYVCVWARMHVCVCVWKLAVGCRSNQEHEVVSM